MIDKKYLEGLVYRDSKRKTVEENGEKKTVFIPTERPLTQDDVRAFRETETEMIFVTADGQKYTLPKIKPAKGQKTDDKDPDLDGKDQK